MDDDLRIPDVEIIIGSAGYDVAVFAFYKREDIHHGYEVVGCLAGKDAAAVIRKILQDAITTINTADWHDVDVLRENAAEEVEEPPF